MAYSQTYYHGTKADLKADDLIEPGNTSNYGKRKKANFVYLTATLDAAIWGAELAVGEGCGKIYIVEPRKSHEVIPFSECASHHRRVTDWQGHSSEQLEEMHDHLANLKQRGVEAIEE